MTGELAVALAVVFAANVIPAFGPPTWALLVYFRFTTSVPIWVLIVGGALAAASGRVVLALAFRHLGRWLPARRRAGLEALGTTLSSTRMGLVASLLFFAVSPIPSNALFEAVGLARVRLAPLTAAFLLGRLCSYSIYVVAASTVSGSVRGALEDGITSPRALALGAIGVVFLVVVVAVDWVSVIERARASAARRLGRRRARHDRRSPGSSGIH